MFKKNRTLGIILILFMLVTAGSVGFFFHKAQANQVSELNMFKKLFVIVDLVKRSYVEETDIDTLLTGAIDGMLESLDDPYTVYLPPRDFENMQEEFDGKYGGIGIVITMKDKQLTVVSPITETPGERAGLEGGDMIMAIDGVSTKDMPMEEAVGMMKGEPGTEVTLTIKRKVSEEESAKEPKEFDVDIVREEIELSYVNSEMKTDKIGYIRLSQFIDGVGEEIATEIEKLHKEGAEAYILDLRNNPGGLLSEASKVASNFIDKGFVVHVKERQREKTSIPVYSGITATDAPLVILVNGGSASASEIVTGAIQDNERGVIVGEKTFGKGVVQSVIPLSDGSAVKLTTAKYYTPKDRFIHHQGIEPDVEVKYNPDTEADEQLDEAIKILEDKLN
ncbi:carboxyl-terminal processing protease [Orenia metallireducens]|uniref:Carboxyl-terminal processing protease n=1 Tax=Orenia metallireducens TaxID=1413210 RepID=A0A285I9Q8_9FIRM|nr:S41 family peptidase [Orenia metallireducens]PRX22480.1 carboxyl-terminal processing protease [Orenia metallireducens]SNY43701.1 carboxyl-terminal processing protease [Orenia metallireducens]